MAEERELGLRGWISGGGKPKRESEVAGGRTSQMDKHRLAVLPMANMSPDPSDEYFADGMTEELISTTSSITGLTLIARTSVMSYKGTNKKVREIGSELEVGTILEGSVRKAGNRLRVTVQLIDVQSQGHLWAQSYDRDLDDVFAVQSDIAKQVADALKVQMLPNEVRQIEKKPTENTEAYVFYIRALQLYHETAEPSLREAVSLFNRAISEDPAFARAYAGLSNAWVSLEEGGYEEFAISTNNAEVAARKALELDSSLAEAHAAMSIVQSSLDKFDESINEANKAVKINPSLADAHLSLGINHATWGRLDQALVSCRKAFDLDPLSARVGRNLALVCVVGGKESEGLEVLERMAELNPNNPRVFVGLAEYYMLGRDYGRAQQMLDKGFAINLKEPLLQINQGLLYALSGKKKEAKESLAEIQRYKIESIRIYGELFLQTALGNFDAAFRTLGRQAELHNWPFLIKSLPIFEDLRKDPRFPEFCMKVGIPV